ncbi:hypothetical protein ACNHE2_10080 [Mannheimia haemolytica]|uniref:hypothetical protein n=1 Tax=Mannheimia haemolytica TaxID=75985 RepID=UPI00295EE35E|nr:hypothetical protein [Mannheimia haemolytica]
MELLFILIALVGFGALLAVGFTFFSAIFGVIATGLLSLISLLANMIGLSIAIILISLYVLLPTNTFIFVAFVFVAILGFLCWYHSDKQSIHQ